MRKIGIANKSVLTSFSHTKTISRFSGFAGTRCAIILFTWLNTEATEERWASLDGSTAGEGTRIDSLPKTTASQPRALPWRNSGETPKPFSTRAALRRTSGAKDVGHLALRTPRPQFPAPQRPAEGNWHPLLFVNRTPLHSITKHASALADRELDSAAARACAPPAVRLAWNVS